MSSTNRGSERSPNDFYETPGWLTRLALRTVFAPGGHKLGVLEPAAGTGAITREARAYWPSAVVNEIDIVRTGKDFLAIPTHPIYDIVITNPPFSLAMEFVQRAHRWACYTPTATVAMLLPLNFLGSEKRAVWLRTHPPALYVSPQRPSFTGGKTDSINYAWMMWQPHNPNFVPKVEILGLPTKAEVKADNLRIREAIRAALKESDA